MPILENPVANISCVRYISILSLIIIDEVSMCPLQVLKIIYAMKMINVNHLEEKQYFCAVIFGKSYQISNMNHLCHKLAWIFLFSKNYVNSKYESFIEWNRICRIIEKKLLMMKPHNSLCLVIVLSKYLKN